ncbi:hypothetical protein O6H91_14G013600 [Diphasiastrum complanatum]|uniref:Uncharacterized protein n=2 Tax=Diphasiastrum complanatum TaxID=34168 RepID=A0ACC2BLN7_DIPCM|nr:hypothetical protein O6H91_14G009700 [Diphasiastrum complanatum]KAJ7530667.1 hypothetical protein O6H91_14G013600 [Diphasiastrum complanatum]
MACLDSQLGQKAEVQLMIKKKYKVLIDTHAFPEIRKSSTYTHSAKHHTTPKINSYHNMDSHNHGFSHNVRALGNIAPSDQNRSIGYKILLLFKYNSSQR